MINPNTISYRMLSDEKIKKVHEATLSVLGKTGVHIEHPKALEYLAGVGCKISDDFRVRFPSEVIEAAIKKAPGSISVYTRDGKPKMILEDRNVYYGTVASLPFMAEPSGNRRNFVLNDCKEMTIIMDYLDTLDFGTGTGLSTDITPQVSDVHEINCMIENSPKPILITTHDENGLKAIIDICAVHKGSIESFKKEPFVVFCVCPISPLKFPDSIIEKMFLAIENGFPFFCLPAPGAGGTSPVSLAGTLVCGNAEILSGLVLAQAIKPGSPYLYGGFFTNMDMQSMIMTHGSPEFSMLNIAQAEMARFYNVPSFSSAGTTDSLSVDEQAAFEAGFTITAAALGGANLVHAAGVIGSGTSVSKEMLVLSDEIINYTKHFAKGIDVSEKMLAVDELEKISPGGSFMDSEMTFELFRTEHWYPKYFQRSQFENWIKAGKVTLNERLSAKCKEILATHIPTPVEADKLAEVEKIIKYSDSQRIK